MSLLSSSTLPVTQPLTDSSCMRFRQRRNVLLPHPDGPMIAVTVLDGNRSDTSFTIARRPNSAVKFAASSRAGASAGGTIALPDRPAGSHGEEEDQPH